MGHQARQAHQEDVRHATRLATTHSYAAIVGVGSLNWNAMTLLLSGRLGRAMWDDFAVSRDEANRRDLAAALDEVTEQLRDMPVHDILDQQDLAWSFDSGVYVEVEVQSDEPLILRLDASKGFFRPTSANRTVRIDSE